MDPPKTFVELRLIMWMSNYTNMFLLTIVLKPREKYRGIYSVMASVVGNSHDHQSSNPGQDYLDFM